MKRLQTTRRAARAARPRRVLRDGLRASDRGVEDARAEVDRGLLQGGVRHQLEDLPQPPHLGGELGVGLYQAFERLGLVAPHLAEHVLDEAILGHVDGGAHGVIP